MTNLGRVQGGGFFYSSSASGVTVDLSTISPISIKPLVGDTILFANGDLRLVNSIGEATVTLGDVVANMSSGGGGGGLKSASVELVEGDTLVDVARKINAVGSNILIVKAYNVFESLSFRLIEQETEEEVFFSGNGMISLLKNGQVALAGMYMTNAQKMGLAMLSFSNAGNEGAPLMLSDTMMYMDSVKSTFARTSSPLTVYYQ